MNAESTPNTPVDARLEAAQAFVKKYRWHLIAASKVLKVLAIVAYQYLG